MADFYEQDMLGSAPGAGMASEESVREMIEQGAKKRKRAVMRT